MAGVARPRILIIGFGFLGSAVATAAARRGLPTRILTRSPPASPAAADFAIGDAAEPATLLRHSRDVDHIVYACGRSIPAAAEDDPLGDLMHALAPLIAMLDACRQHGCSLTLLSSGGTVYGRARAIPIAEDHPTDPVSAYGIRSLAAEKFAAMRAARDGINLHILRIGNPYGAGQRLRASQGIVAALLHCAATRRPVTVYGDGLGVRDYVSVADVADAVLDLLGLPPATRIVNVGSGRGHSTLDLIAICSAVTGQPMPVAFERARDFDVRDSVLDIGLARRLIGFSPAAIEPAMRRIWERMAARPAEYALS
jgi:UDP-glucose 4-epimerase